MALAKYMQEVSSGAAQVTLDTLESILQNFSQTAAHHGYSNAGQDIVTKIKNTMSDRASAQKSFNHLLAEYRANTSNCHQELGNTHRTGEKLKCTTFTVGCT